MASDNPDAVRKRRSRRHTRGDHSLCLPEARCRQLDVRKQGPHAAEHDPATPREMLEQEVTLVRDRLAVLGAALAGRPFDIELLAEIRGQQRVLVSLLTAAQKLAPAAPVTPIRRNPLHELRADLERRRAEARRRFAEANPGEAFYG